MYRRILYKKYLSAINLSEEEIEKNFNRDLTFQGVKIEALPKDKDTAMILDLGCGFGTFLNNLRKKGFKNLYGVDVGEEEHKFLKSKGLYVIQKDILEFLKTNNIKYDLITLFDVLEHFKKDEIVEIIPLLYKSLNKNGKLIIRVPNGEAIFKGSIMYGDFTHETFFTKRSIIQLFNTFEFSEINIYPVNNFGKSWKAILAKIIYLSYVKFYKTLLKIDNTESVRYFISTQNLLGIIKK